MIKVTARLFSLTLLPLLAGCNSNPPMMASASKTLTLQYQIYADGGLDALTVPSPESQAKILALGRSAEVQISALCKLQDGRVLSCERLRTVPHSTEVQENAERLLKQFVVTRAAKNAARSAMFDVRVAEPGTELGASGECIVIMCGFPTPRAPRPPSEN